MPEAVQGITSLNFATVGGKKRKTVNKKALARHTKKVKKAYTQFIRLANKKVNMKVGGMKVGGMKVGGKICFTKTGKVIHKDECDKQNGEVEQPVSKSVKINQYLENIANANAVKSKTDTDINKLTDEQTGIYRKTPSPNVIQKKSRSARIKANEAVSKSDEFQTPLLKDTQIETYIENEAKNKGQLSPSHVTHRQANDTPNQRPGLETDAQKEAARVFTHRSSTKTPPHPTGKSIAKIPTGSIRVKNEHGVGVDTQEGRPLFMSSSDLSFEPNADGSKRHYYYHDGKKIYWVPGVGGTRRRRRRNNK